MHRLLLLYGNDIAGELEDLKIFIARVRATEKKRKAELRKMLSFFAEINDRYYTRAYVSACKGFR
jgi:Tfp pilus assembly protein PilP